jgi:ubiquinone/menaquinone biosynthesis C-methylase UbiE
MTATRSNYALLQSEHEYRRLAVQAEYLKPMTRRLFSEAGISPGMRVLDLGAGAGDICLLLAEMVGPSGSVTGVELDPSAIEFARQRTSAFPNIDLVEADFIDHMPDQPYDAIVGRYVLLYQADPAASLAAVARHLRPGGSVAFMEPWFTPPGGPDSPIRRIATCVIETLRRSGAHIDMGPRLYKTFTAAGLPGPQMRMEMVVDGSPDSPFFQYIADTFVSILPKALEYGLVQPDEIKVEEVPGIFKAALGHMGYALTILPTILAWCRTPLNT